jgi:hypothetical protein
MGKRASDRRPDHTGEYFTPEFRICSPMLIPRPVPGCLPEKHGKPWPNIEHSYTGSELDSISQRLLIFVSAV